MRLHLAYSFIGTIIDHEDMDDLLMKTIWSSYKDV